MSYLIAVAAFGCLAVFFLWGRDIRIAVRTGNPAYLSAARMDVLYSIIALTGFFITANGILEILGLGIILLALYLQGRTPRKVDWGNAHWTDRALGRAPLPKNNGKEKKQ
jgi:hypothetical protein